MKRAPIDWMGLARYIHIEYPRKDPLMASTSFSLGKHWDDFIKQKVAEGRYGTGTEVVREALRRMEVEEQKLDGIISLRSMGPRRSSGQQ